MAIVVAVHRQIGGPQGGPGANGSSTRRPASGVRVVIDPGHGGRDPGAQADQLNEAALVLDVARRLETRLTEARIDVVLTRRSDSYVPLEDRFALANRVDGDCSFPYTPTPHVTASWVALPPTISGAAPLGTHRPTRVTALSFEPRRAR